MVIPGMEKSAWTDLLNSQKWLGPQHSTYKMCLIAQLKNVHKEIVRSKQATATASKIFFTNFPAGLLHTLLCRAACSNEPNWLQDNWSHLVKIFAEQTIENWVTDIWKTSYGRGAYSSGDSSWIIVAHLQLIPRLNGAIGRYIRLPLHCWISEGAGKIL